VADDTAIPNWPLVARKPKMDFGRDQSFTLMDATVIRAMDADLR